MPLEATVAELAVASVATALQVVAAALTPSDSRTSLPTSLRGAFGGTLFGHLPGCPNLRRLPALELRCSHANKPNHWLPRLHGRRLHHLRKRHPRRHSQMGSVRHWHWPQRWVVSLHRGLGHLGMLGMPGILGMLVLGMLVVHGLLRMFVLLGMLAKCTMLGTLCFSFRLVVQHVGPSRGHGGSRRQPKLKPI